MSVDDADDADLNVNLHQLHLNVSMLSFMSSCDVFKLPLFSCLCRNLFPCLIVKINRTQICLSDCILSEKLSYYSVIKVRVHILTTILTKKH